MAIKQGVVFMAKFATNKLIWVALSVANSRVEGVGEEMDDFLSPGRVETSPLRLSTFTLVDSSPKLPRDERSHEMSRAVTCLSQGGDQKARGSL